MIHDFLFSLWHYLLLLFPHITPAALPSSNTWNMLHLRTFALAGSFPWNSSFRDAVSYKSYTACLFISFDFFFKFHLLSEDFPHALVKMAIPPPKPWSSSLHSTCYHLKYYMFNFFICFMSSTTTKVSLLREDIYVCIVHC